MNTRLLAGATAGLASLAVLPAAASAAITATYDKPCYTDVPGQPGGGPEDTLTITLAGGTPGADFQVNTHVPDGAEGFASGTFDPAGNAVARIPGIYPPTGSDPTKGQQIGLGVIDYGLGANSPEQPLPPALVTRLAMKLDLTAHHARSRTISVSGTPYAGQPMSAFLVRGKRSGTHVLKRVSLGTADGCGYAARKVAFAPKRLKTGNYTLWVNPGNKLDKAHALGRELFFSRFF